MSKVIVQNLIILVCLIYTVTTHAHFKGVGGGVIFANAMALPPQSSVSGPISLAGGGVILQGISKPETNCKSCEILGIDIFAVENTNNQKLSSVETITKDCKASYTAPTSLVKDAALLVNSEEPTTIYRNVSLLGQPTESEKRLLANSLKGGNSSDPLESLRVREFVFKHFFVELSEALVGTKSGEVLMVVDLILTDPEFYAQFNLDRSYDALDLHGNIALDTANYPAVKIYNQKMLLVKFFGSLRNWTWTDEKSNFTFSISCNSNKLLINGTPSFTFLNENKEALVSPTKYFENNSHIIENLNPPIFEYANKFSRLAAFFRYLKGSKPKLWSGILKTATDLPSSIGSTPRIIER